MANYDTTEYWLQWVQWWLQQLVVQSAYQSTTFAYLPGIATAVENLAYYESAFAIPTQQAAAASLGRIADTALPDVSTAVKGAGADLHEIARTALPQLGRDLGISAKGIEFLLANLLPALNDSGRLSAVSLNALATDAIPKVTASTTTIADVLKALALALAPTLGTWAKSGPADEKIKVVLAQWLSGEVAEPPAPEAASAFLSALGGLVVELGRLVAASVKRGVDILHGPIEEVVLPFIAGTFDEYQDNLEIFGELQPDDASDLALGAFDAALRLGAQSHGLSQAVELIHPLKHLGLGHLAAGLADAAGFEPVMRSAILRRLDVALGRTTEMQARKAHRTVWAALREYTEMWLEERISTEQFRERLRVEGWPEWQIDAYLGEGERDRHAVPYREARPIDLAYIYEDMTSPDDWILQQLTQSGFHREDAQQLMVGLRRRSMRTHTSAYVSELVGAFGDGLIDQAALRSYLQGLGLRQEAEDLVVNRAAMSYFRQTSKDLLAVYRDMVDKSLLSITDFRVAVAGLGFQQATIAAEVARLDARARGRLLVEEQREAEAAVREVQRLLGTEYAERVRRGLVTPESMEQVLVHAGVEQAQAAAMARIAAIRQIPALKLPEALTPEAQAQQVRDILTRDALLRVRQRQLSIEGAVTYLVSIGVDKAEAAAAAGLAWQQGWRPPTVEPPPKEAPEVREARRNRTQATVAAFQAGEFDERELTKRLVALGHSDAVAASIVEQQATERRLRLEKTSETERAKVLAEVQQLEQDLIMGLVRSRQIVRDNAVAALISIGVTDDQAALLVKRELEQGPTTLILGLVGKQQITPEEAVARLLKLKIDQVQAVLLVREELLRAGVKVT